jgi:serine phosphatase RsbU (regulator of sigma subunit)
VYGPVRTVVWQGSVGDRRPYADLVGDSEIRVTLRSSSALIVYTDGLTDALNSLAEEFGENRLMSYCASLPKGANAQAICELLSSKIADWSAGVEQSDDGTILVLTVE